MVDPSVDMPGSPKALASAKDDVESKKKSSTPSRILPTRSARKDDANYKETLRVPAAAAAAPAVKSKTTNVKTISFAIVTPEDTTQTTQKKRKSGNEKSGRAKKAKSSDKQKAESSVNKKTTKSPVEKTAKALANEAAQKQKTKNRHELKVKLHDKMEKTKRTPYNPLASFI